MFQGGIVPSQLDNENYFEILRVLKAKSREDRPLNSEDAHRKLAQLLRG